MKKIRIIAILAATILVAGLITAGCTQDAGSPGSNPSGDSQQYSGTSGDNSSPFANGGYHGSNPGGAGGNRQFRGQNPLSNETMLIAAAGKLGVSEQDLKNALNSTVNTTSGRFRGRGNMTAPPVSNQ